MTLHEGFRLLLETTCASGIAVLLILLLRRPLRAAFGANIAYASWLLVPLMTLAVLLPAPSVEVVLTAIPMAAPIAGRVAEPGPFDPIPLLLALWIAGVAFMALRNLRLQRRFLRDLGVLRVLDNGLLQSERSAGLPAVIGLKARIILPVDFDTRYDAAERELILAHERIHVARRDVISNAAVVAFRCLYWFNPLLWAAAECFRRDQELACDQTVISRHPNARRRYGEAMMKTQLSILPVPLACHWFGGHPLKERIAMLKRPAPSIRRTLAGMTFVCAISLAGGYAAWAAQPVQAIQKEKPVQSAQKAGLRQEPELANIMSVPERTPPPKYPADAVEKKQSGRVLLRILVGADGSAKDVQVESAKPAGVFEQVSVAAASQWKFNPLRKNGKAVEGWVRVPIDFEIPAPPAPPAPPMPPQSPAHPVPPPPLEPITVGAKGYEWIHFDEKEMQRIKQMSCDVISFDEKAKSGYCGIRKTA